MKAIRFVNKSECTKCANKLRLESTYGGLEDLNSLSVKVIVSPEQCIQAAQCFEEARKEGGKYISNIIKEPFFTSEEIKVILQHL